MQEVRAFLVLEQNDFSWTSWKDQHQAISEINSIIIELEKGSLPEMRVLFAPTGPIQEVSLSSGWGDKFIDFAKRFDYEYERARNQL